MEIFSRFPTPSGVECVCVCVLCSHCPAVYLCVQVFLLPSPYGLVTIYYFCRYKPRIWVAGYSFYMNCTMINGTKYS